MGGSESNWLLSGSVFVAHVAPASAADRADKAGLMLSCQILEVAVTNDGITLVVMELVNITSCYVSSLEVSKALARALDTNNVDDLIRVASSACSSVKVSLLLL